MENLKTLTTRQNSWLWEKREQTMILLNDILSKPDSNKLSQADYREVAELTIILLVGIPPQGIHFNRPGAIHQARWMAINIYCIKMFVFGDEIGYDAVTQNNLQRINHFLVLFLYSYWMTAILDADAPNNDLQLIHEMMEYQMIDKEVADAAL